MVETYKTLSCGTKAKEAGREGLASSTERLMSQEKKGKVFVWEWADN